MTDFENMTDDEVRAWLLDSLAPYRYEEGDLVDLYGETYRATEAVVRLKDEACDYWFVTDDGWDEAWEKAGRVRIVRDDDTPLPAQVYAVACEASPAWWPGDPGIPGCAADVGLVPHDQ